jgi:hypothetical protein
MTMPQGSEIVWHPTGARHHVVRWLLGLGAVAIVIGFLNGGVPPEPDIKLPQAAAPAPAPVALPARKPSPPVPVEPVILNAPDSDASRMTEPIAESSAARVQAHAPADYQALRRELFAD